MKTLNLRIWIPLLILLLTGFLLIGIFLFQLNQDFNSLKRNSIEEVKVMMSRLQQDVEKELLLPEHGRIEQEISTLALIPEVKNLFLLDNNGTILYSLHYAWKKRPVSEVFADFNQQVWQQVMQSKHFKVFYDRKKNAVFAFYPVQITASSGHIRSLNYGMLYLYYDLTWPFNNILANSLQKILQLSIGLLMLMVLLFFILTRVITRPVEHLIEVMQLFAKHEKPVYAKLTGNGELAKLGHTFNQLVDRLLDNKSRLIRQKNLYNTLSQTNQMIIRVREKEELFKEICQIIVEHGGFVLAVISKIENNKIKQNYFVGHPKVQAFLIDHPDLQNITETSISKEVIDKNHPVIINDYQQAPLTQKYHTLAQRFNIQSCAAFPIRQFDKTVAILKIYSLHKNFFDEEIIQLLNGMSNDISFALENIQLSKVKEQAEQTLKEREKNLEVTLNSIGDAVIVTDAKGRIARMNPVAEQLTGWTLDEARGKPLTKVFHIIHALTREEAVNPVQKVMQTGHIVGLANHTALIAKDGTEYQIADSAAPITDEEHNIIGVILVFHDVTDQYQTQAQIKENEQRFRQVNEVTGAYIWELDENLCYTYLTQQVSHVKGYSVKQLLGKKFSDFIVAEDREYAQKTIAKAIENKSSFELTLRNKTQDGKILWEEITGQVTKDNYSNKIKICGAGISITERKKAEAEIKKLAFYDPLTNLPNRRMLTDRLEHEIASSKRHQQYGAILFFDLDHFKNLNDSLGHDIGDELLKQVANRLNTLLRAEDTAARLGGDEFIVLLTNLGNGQQQAINSTTKTAKKIHQTLLAPYQLKNHEYHLSVSFGITLFPQPEQSLNDLIKQADTALYRAKYNGRNNFQFFRQEMQDTANQRLMIEKELRQALINQHVQLYFQPQVHSNGEPVGAEALIRWTHPEKGLIAPDQFIQIAEESGIILDVDLWVIEAAFKQMQSWLNSFKLDPEFTLSINLSPKFFKQPDFVDSILNLLEEYSISAQRFILEITENLFLTDLDETILKMQQLKDAGFRFSIDDFGTGYSSLSYLKRLPLFELKIDRTFITDLESNPSDQAIVETILSMACHLNLQVLAEGIENDKQLAFLQQHQCHLYQGYYFSKPLSSSDFETFMQTYVR